MLANTFSAHTFALLFNIDFKGQKKPFEAAHSDYFAKVRFGAEAD